MSAEHGCTTTGARPGAAHPHTSGSGLPWMRDGDVPRTALHRGAEQLGDLGPCLASSRPGSRSGNPECRRDGFSGTASRVSAKVNASDAVVVPSHGRRPPAGDQQLGDLVAAKEGPRRSAAVLPWSGSLGSTSAPGGESGTSRQRHRSWTIASAYSWKTERVHAGAVSGSGGGCGEYASRRRAQHEGAPTSFQRGPASREGVCPPFTQGDAGRGTSAYPSRPVHPPRKPSVGAVGGWPSGRRGWPVFDGLAPWSR